MFNLLNAITAGTAIFLAFLVVAARKDANTVANRWLGAFLLMVGMFMLDDALLVFGIYKQRPWLFGYLGLPAYALAPALYLTVSQFVTVERRFRKKGFLHFLPFLLFVLLSTPFLLSSNEIKLQELTLLELPMTLSDKILLSLLMAQIVIYLFFSFRKLKKHHKNIALITASPAEFNLDWLLYFLYGVGCIVLIWFSEILFIDYHSDASWYTPAYFLAIYCLGYFALRQKEVYPFTQTEAAELGEIMVENEDQIIVARRQTVQPEKLGPLKAQLLKVMETEKPYLDPELNLPGLARSLGLSVHEMSELVNTGFGENFAQFVNRYRVEESKRLLYSEKHAHLSMVGIAFEAGFNSKTAFNTAFKKTVGVSPTEFQKRGNQAV